MPQILNIFSIATLIIFSQAGHAETKLTSCHSAREFITTLEYLRDKKAFALDEQHSQKIAHKVSKGCSGSAKRFINAVELLDKVETGSNIAIKIGLRLSKESDTFTETYVGVFKRAYLKEYFDLDLTTSLKMAESLSFNYKGDVKMALNDFVTLTQFCLGKEVNLPPAKCARISQEIVKNNEFQRQSVAHSFIRVYKFVQKTETIQASIQEALIISRRVVKVSPNAADNFIEGYKYAVSEKGLKLSAGQSLEIAYTLTDRTIPSPNSIDNKLRLPANSKN